MLERGGFMELEKRGYIIGQHLGFNNEYSDSYGGSTVNIHVTAYRDGRVKTIFFNDHGDYEDRRRRFSVEFNKLNDDGRSEIEGIISDYISECIKKDAGFIKEINKSLLYDILEKVLDGQFKYSSKDHFEKREIIYTGLTV